VREKERVCVDIMIEAFSINNIIKRGRKRKTETEREKARQRACAFTDSFSLFFSISPACSYHALTSRGETQTHSRKKRERERERERLALSFLFLLAELAPATRKGSRDEREREGVDG